MKFLNNRLARILFSDVYGKLICVVIALFLWYYATVFSLARTRVSLPIQLINIPADLKVTPPNNMFVQVEIVAREDVSQIIDNINAFIDLSDPLIGNNRYDIRLENVPSDLSIEFFPENKRILVERIENKTVPLSITLTSEKGVMNYQLTPNTVAIRSTSQDLSTISNISLGEVLIPVSAQENQFITNIPLPAISNISYVNISNVMLTIDFYDGYIANNIILPIRIIGLNRRLSFKNPPTIPLTVLSPQKEIESILKDSEIILDAEIIRSSGDYTIPIAIHTPTNITILNAPSSITLEVISNN